MANNILNYQFIEQLRSVDAVEKIWLFGSRARGDHQERSDIDLALLCPKASDQDWVSILEIIDDADTLLKIDCVRFDQAHLSQALKDNIVRDRKVIYVKNSDKT